MRITAKNEESWLEIVPRQYAPGEYSGFEVEGVLDLGHGRFSGRNREVLFQNKGAFADALDDFVLDRSLVPCLEGTYRSYIRFRAKGLMVFVEFCIGDYFAGHFHGALDHECRVVGGFELPADQLLGLVEFFKSAPVQNA